MMSDRKRLLIVDHPIRIPASKFAWISQYDNATYSRRDEIMARIRETIFNPVSPYFGWSADVRVDGLSINNIIGVREPFSIINTKVVTQYDLLKTQMEIAKGRTEVRTGSGVNKTWWRVWK